MKHRRLVASALLVLVVSTARFEAWRLFAQARDAARGQKIDQEYTSLIKQHLQDPRITTELVDHLPASETVPSPLKFFGRIVGTPGELTYARDIHRYFEALSQASPRARLWKIGTSEEGRDLVLLAVADEATIRSLEKYKEMLRALTDPRRTPEARAQQLLKTAKPVYYLTSGIHSPETGGPEMLMELAYRLIVEESPFIQSIRNNVITLITPVLEVDGRERQVDTYYFNKGRGNETRLPLVYWGKYVQHDNNRDGIGQFLKLTQAVTRQTLEWHPTVLHDLHEAQSYLYVSTGTGPYNHELDPIVVGEWWMLAQNDVVEMTKRGVPGVWTYGFYDGWVPNYMFFIAHTHNATGRFYEVQRYGPDLETMRADATTTSKEWFRPNPPLPTIQWGPRNNVNIQQSAVLFSLRHVARNRDLYLENYWLKNRRAVEKGRAGPVHAWVVPANQRRKSDAAIAVNDLRRQGLEFSRATSAFTAGGTSVVPGDYIVRGDQPFRTLADMYFAVQRFAPQNPAPYDDTGWTFQYLRDLRIVAIEDRSILEQPMTPITADVSASGGIDGDGRVLIVDHTGDNNLVTFRFRNPSTRMLAAEEAFTVAGQTYAAGSIIVPDADRRLIEPVLNALGLSARAVSTLPSVPTHDLDIPRIGVVHSWVRTQDEGWWRAAFDAYGVPYTYFSDQKLRAGNLRASYDVLVLPNIGGGMTSQVNGLPKGTGQPLPYRKTDLTPNLGGIDESDDIRGGMGVDGLGELARFVEQGGTLITEASTAAIFPEYGLTPGVRVETPDQLFVRGSILRGTIADPLSPIVYGYGTRDLPVYFSQGPVLNVDNDPTASTRGDERTEARAQHPNAGLGQNITPNAVPLHVSPLDAESWLPTMPGNAERPDPEAVARLRQRARDADPLNVLRPRVVMRFPRNAVDMLLSGTLANGSLLADRAVVVDHPLGKGHVVMFALRAFWRWQTHGTYPLGFNTLLNWNDLDAGRPSPERTVELEQHR